MLKIFVRGFWTMLFVLLGISVNAGNLLASDGFLTLPFNIKEKKVDQGYFYNDGGTHEGIDYIFPTGTPIYAAADGVAMNSSQKVDSSYAYGNFVIINHQNGYFTLYAHLNTVIDDIKKYDEGARNNRKFDDWTSVKRGQLLGTCGTSGTTIAHLHFETTTGGYAKDRVDPYDLYSKSKDYPPIEDKKCGSVCLWLSEYPTLAPNYYIKQAYFSSPYSILNLGWLDVYRVGGANPQSTFISAGSFDGGSRDGLHSTSMNYRNAIYYHEVWQNDKELKNGQILNKLYRLSDGDKAVTAMTSGNFGGGENDILAIAYKWDDKIYFYHNNRFNEPAIGVLDPHPGVSPKITNLTAGDVDGDGFAELMVTVKNDDHVYLFDDWNNRTFLIKAGFLDAHDNNPEIVAITTMDIDSNGLDELLIATDVDDHIYVYYYDRLKSFSLPGVLAKPFVKQGYIDAHESNPRITSMVAGKFNDKEDHLAVSTDSDDHVYFYWGRNLDEPWGKIFNQKQYKDVVLGQSNPIIGLTAGNFDDSNEEEELATINVGDDHVNFLGIGESFSSVSYGGREVTFSAKTISQSDKQIILRPGEVKEVWVEFENTGTAGWFTDSNPEIRLYLDPQNRNSIFNHGWDQTNSPTKLIDSEIMPGGKTRLKFNVWSPVYSGTYQEKFNLYAGTNKLAGAGFTLDIIIDAEPPQKVKNLRTNEAESHWYQKYTNDNTPAFLWDKATDNETSIDGYFVAIDDPTPDGEFDFDWSVADVDAWETATELSDGWHTVAVTSRDKAGNVNPKNTNKLGDAPYLKFMVDTMAPTKPTNLTGEQTKSNWVGNITNNKKPYFTWDMSSDSGSGVRKYIIENKKGGETIATYEIGQDKFKTDKYWRMPDYLTNGDYTLAVKAMDWAGNYSTVIDFAYKIDLSAPVGTIEINNNDEFTNIQDVKLKINAIDESDITQYKISNNNSTWTTFNLSNSNSLNISDMPWQLENGDGTRKVYVRFTDSLGNTSNIFTDEIILDVTKPESVVDGLATWQNTLDFLVSWFGTDNLSGILNYDVQYKDSVVNSWVDWLTNTELTQKIFSGLDGVTYWFRSRGYDKADNTEDYQDTADTQTIVDVSMPDAPTISSPVANSILNNTVDENPGVVGVQVTVSGTGEIGGDIELISTNSATNNTNSYLTVVDGFGNWSISDVLIGEGDNRLNATITDSAGNSNDSGDHRVTLDTITPDALNDLAVINTTYQSAQISWIAPGDDGMSGTATLYDIRYSTNPITAINFDLATQVASPPAPEVTGTNQNVIINGLDPKETYYFAIKTKDNAENWSDISNVVSTTTQTSANSVALSSDKSMLKAEGVQTASLTATIYDPDNVTGIKLAGESVTMSITDENGVPGETGSLSGVTDNNDGTYSAVYTSATKVGDGKITIEVVCSTCMTTQTASLDIDLIPGDPAGVIALTSIPATIDADGTSESNVSSSIIYDLSGNQVTDGALITVATDLGNIISADEDAVTPGIQIATASGVINFDLQSEVWNGYGIDQTNATVSVTSVLGTATGTTQVVLLDVSAPAKPIITSPVNNFITNDNTPTITGQAEKNSRVLVYKKQGAGAWQYQYYTTANSSGNFSYTFGSSLVDGDWSFRVRARDTALNDSVYSDAVAVIIDTVKPTISNALPLAGTYYHRTETVSANYSDNAGGTGIDASTALLKINGSTKPAIITATDLSYTNTYPDSNGTNNVYVEVSDNAGNKQTKSWTFSIQLFSYFMSDVDESYKSTIIPNWPNSNGIYSASNWWDMAYDDSAWSSNIFSANLPPATLVKADVNSDWLWGDGSVNTNETTLIRYKFNLPSGVEIDDAAIRLSAENEAWGFAGFVNGINFGKVPEAISGNNPHVFGLLPFLQAGQNLLSIQVSNDGDNRAGVSYSMTVKYHD